MIPLGMKRCQIKHKEDKIFFRLLNTQDSVEVEGETGVSIFYPKYFRLLNTQDSVEVEWTGVSTFYPVDTFLRKW